MLFLFKIIEYGVSWLSSLVWVNPSSFMLPNHHAPPSIAFLLLINYKANKHRLACWLKSSPL